MKKHSANQKRESRRKFLNTSFGVISLLVASLAIVILIMLLSSILIKGGSALSFSFLTQDYVETKEDPREAGSGVRQAVIGTTVLCLICGAVALPIGIGTAIFLEEFKPRNKVLRFFHSFIQLNINNLAGVPSVVYGMLGLTAFVYMFNVFGQVEVDKPAKIETGISYQYQVKTLADTWVTLPCSDKTVQKLKPSELPAGTMATDQDGNEFELRVLARGETRPSDPDEKARTIKSNALISLISKKKPYYFRLPFGKSVLAASLTLALVILPIVIIAAQEAIRAVPDSLREAAFGMGTTRWQMIRETVLPSATPGIMTGAILSMSRAIGEAAPILVIMGAIKADAYSNLMEKTTTMPVLIYGMASHSNNGYEPLAAAAIIVLLIVLLIINSIAVFVRYRSEKKYKLA